MMYESNERDDRRLALGSAEFVVGIILMTAGFILSATGTELWEVLLLFMGLALAAIGLEKISDRSTTGIILMAMGSIVGAIALWVAYNGGCCHQSLPALCGIMFGLGVTYKFFWRTKNQV